jgi:hypothetical protein
VLGYCRGAAAGCMAAAAVAAAAAAAFPVFNLLLLLTLAQLPSPSLCCLQLARGAPGGALRDSQAAGHGNPGSEGAGACGGSGGGAPAY